MDLYTLGWNIRFDSSWVNSLSAFIAYICIPWIWIKIKSYFNWYLQSTDSYTRSYHYFSNFLYNMHSPLISRRSSWADMTQQFSGFMKNGVRRTFRRGYTLIMPSCKLCPNSYIFMRIYCLSAYICICILYSKLDSRRFFTPIKIDNSETKNIANQTWQHRSIWTWLRPLNPAS